MRRLWLGVLTALETLVFSAILVCSWQLAHEIRASASVARVAHVVLATTRYLAYGVHRAIRRA